MRVLLLPLAAAALATAAASERDAAACRALGFDADALDCRRCDELAAALSPSADASALTSDCRACCADVSALAAAMLGGDRRHTRVVLEVCTCKFGRYPKVANFVHQHAAKHPKLSIEYINARHPFLIFYDAEGVKQEEISIAGWDEDTINEFIVAKVAPDEVSEENVEASDASNIAESDEVAEEEEEMKQESTVQENDEL